jgi:phage tail-like protein
MSLDTESPLTLFNFKVEFEMVKLGQAASVSSPDICGGSFSDCTGLEATMEPKVVKAGGSNYGAYQRVGPVTFATVVLKRGVTTNRDLWKTFSTVSERGGFAMRFNVAITALTRALTPLYTARLTRALPIKLKCGDFNARGTEITIEELHLAHEGLSLDWEGS